MKKDESQNIYKEATAKAKSETMNWDFEDFLEKAKDADKSTIAVPLKKRGSISKIWWLAASIILLLSLGLFYQYDFKKEPVEIEKSVRNEMAEPTPDFTGENTLAQAVPSDTLQVKRPVAKPDSSSRADQKETDLMDQILPKRGRLKKAERQRFTNNRPPEKAAKPTGISDYKSSYVIINGQKIENEQEAIDLTKYSFRVLSDNVSKTMASADALNTFNNDY